MCNLNCRNNAYKANIIIASLAIYSLVNQNYLQYSIDNITERSFRLMKLTDAKIWISKNMSLCWVFANCVTHGTWYA